MKVVIIGAGNVGTQLADQLIQENKNVVLIEKDPDRAKVVSNQLDCMVINDEGNKLEVLKQADLDKADYFVALTDSDELNMVTCGLVSSQFNVPVKIARVRNIDYGHNPILAQDFLGIDHIVNPEIETSRAILRAVDYGAMSDVLFFERTDFQMRNITITSNSPFVNKTVSEIKGMLGKDALVGVILRDDYYIIPSGKTKILKYDNVYLIASKSDLEDIFSKIGRKRIELNKILIVGGGSIGRHVAELLLERRIQHAGILQRISSFFSGKPPSKGKWGKTIKIIDKDYVNCKYLADKYPQATIVHGDVSDEDIIEDEQFSNFDLIITATQNQELNIITAVYAKKLGIKRTIALVNNNHYLRISNELGIDVGASRINSMVNSILKRIRKGNISSVHSISGGMVEVIEFTVDSKSNVIGKTIKELKLPHSTLILSVTREDHNIIPDGSFTFKAEDHVIIIARKGAIKKIEDIFVTEK